MEYIIIDLTGLCKWIRRKDGVYLVDAKFEQEFLQLFPLVCSK